MKLNRTVCFFFLLSWLFVVSRSTPLRESESEPEHEPEHEPERERDQARDIDREIRDAILDAADIDRRGFQLQRRCATFNCQIFRKLRLGLAGSRNRYRYRYGSQRKIYGNRSLRELRQRNADFKNQVKKRDD